MRAVLISGAVACVGAWLTLFVLLKSGLAWRIAVDEPNARSLHVKAVPRVGGLVVIGIALVVMVSAGPALQMLAIITLGLMVVCTIDDRRGLSVPTRLVIQFVAATAAAFTLMTSAPLWILVLSIVVIVWSMNLYNFMDGADGLAGGMAVFGFTAFAIVALGAGAHGIAITCACLAGAAGGFLIHNFPPATLFLGDAGSVPLGFLAATIGIAGWNHGLWPPWFPVLVFSPFVVDASVTVTRRALLGARIWHGHREHLYQQMVAAGFGHARTAVAWYALMAVVTALAICAVSWSINWQIALLLGWLAAYAVLYASIIRLVRAPADEA